MPEIVPKFEIWVYCICWTYWTYDFPHSSSEVTNLIFRFSSVCVGKSYFWRRKSSSLHFLLLCVCEGFKATNRTVNKSGWPSGLRRQFKALVFGRGFESHSGQILDSIVASIPACHAGDPGSIPGRGGFFCIFTLLKSGFDRSSHIQAHKANATFSLCTPVNSTIPHALYWIRSRGLCFFFFFFCSRNKHQASTQQPNNKLTGQPTKMDTKNNRQDILLDWLSLQQMGPVVWEIPFW